MVPKTILALAVSAAFAASCGMMRSPESPVKFVIAVFQIEIIPVPSIEQTPNGRSCNT